MRSVKERHKEIKEQVKGVLKDIILGLKSEGYTNIDTKFILENYNKKSDYFTNVAIRVLHDEYEDLNLEKIQILTDNNVLFKVS